MRLFVFGATGATGHVLVPMAREAGHQVPFHVRPASQGKSELSRHADAQVFDLDDAERLAQALRGRDVVISLIGTMQKRFASGDTYASSDVGTTRALVSACEKANVPRFLLLSSYGAGGVGAYLQMKRECERIVESSSLAWTIFRPSALVSPKDASVSAHGARREPPLMGLGAKLVGHLPGMKGWAEDVAPIGIEVLCRAILDVAEKPRNGAILSGRDLR